MNESRMDSSAPIELADQITALRQQVFALLVVMIVVSGALAVYLWYQSHIVEKDFETDKPQAARVIQLFNQNSAYLDKFGRQLVIYGRTHPDFRLILKKYQAIGLLGADTNAMPAK